MFQGLPQVFLICLNNRVTCVDKIIAKSQVLVNQFERITVEDGKTITQQNYELVLAMCHIGKNSESGHYVCYSLKDKDTVIVLDDCRVEEKKLNKAKSTLEGNG